MNTMGHIQTAINRISKSLDHIDILCSLDCHLLQTVHVILVQMFKILVGICNVFSSRETYMNSVPHPTNHLDTVYLLVC